MVRKGMHSGPREDSIPYRLFVLLPYCCYCSLELWLQKKTKIDRDLPVIVLFVFVGFLIGALDSIVSFAIVPFVPHDQVLTEQGEDDFDEAFLMPAHSVGVIADATRIA